jgi:hypothetical protein
MARTSLTPVQLKSTYLVVADEADFTLVAVDTTNGNMFTYSGSEILIVQNSGGSPYTVTLTSIADSCNRVGDLVYTLAAGEFACFVLKDLEGWLQADGKFYLTASNIAVKVAVLRMP